MTFKIKLLLVFLIEAKTKHSILECLNWEHIIDFENTIFALLSYFQNTILVISHFALKSYFENMILV